MTIQTRTEIYYYCTVCDMEYDKADKEDGKVCIRCASDKYSLNEGCQNCMNHCHAPNPEKIRSHLKGCGKWFCDNCIGTTKYFDTWYPSILCKECIERYGLQRFYGEDHGEGLWKEIEEWRRVEYGKFPVKVMPNGEHKKIWKKEMDQRIFERFYVSAKRKKIKDGWIS